MSELHDMVREFHEKFSLPVLSKPEIPPLERRQLRISLVLEEFEELCHATEAKDLVGIADALADLLYVIEGFALECGIPLDLVLAEVHRSNMTKLWDGFAKYREDGKVLKPPTYSPPDIVKILEEFSHG